MNRKRMWITIGAIVGGVIVLAIAIGVISLWPMITGKTVAAGPAPSKEEFAAASLSQPEAAAEPAPEAPLRAMPSTVEAAGVKAGAGVGETLGGHWVCYQGNDLQPENSEYYFSPSEDGSTGQLMYYNDPSLDPGLEDSWVTADYEVTEDGVLTISSSAVGFVSQEYQIGFQEEEYAGRTYLYMGMASLAEGDEDMDSAVLGKIAAMDPAWDEWVTDGLDADAFAWATDDEFSLAEEITAAHYPQFEVWAALVEAGDPESEEYVGDKYFVYAGIPETYTAFAMTYYVAADESAEPVWTDEANMPDGYEADEAEDGTAYIWDSVSLAALQDEEPDPAVVEVASWACSDFPYGYVYAVDGDEASANVLITKWDAYPMVPDAGFFELEYRYNEEGWWDLESSSGP